MVNSRVKTVRGYVPGYRLKQQVIYNGEQAAAPPEFHPQMPLHIELQQALLESIQGQPMLAEGRLNALLEHGQKTGRQMLSVMALNQKVTLLLNYGCEPEARQPQGLARAKELGLLV